MRPLHVAALGVLLGAAPAGAQAPAAGPPRLSFPLACQIRATCEVQNYMDRDPGPEVQDYRCGHRTYDGHGGVDIRLPDMAAQRRGVNVLAAAPGRVARLRDGVADISFRAAGAASVKDQECGNGVVVDHGAGWETQYCHLARGSLVVKVGDQVVAGQPLARVGLSGKTEFAHLHLSVRHGGATVDPFAPVAGKACGARGSLWTAAAEKALAYKAGAVLNAGFTDAPVTMPQIETGGLRPPAASSPVMVAYVRAIGLQRGDAVELTLTDPKGAVLATMRQPPLDRDKAQQFLYVGKKRPAAGWLRGAYRAVYRVHRGGQVVLSRTFQAPI